MYAPPSTKSQFNANLNVCPCSDHASCRPVPTHHARVLRVLLPDACRRAHTHPQDLFERITTLTLANFNVPLHMLHCQHRSQWRNLDAAAYFVSAIVNATLQDGVDATWTDDPNGVPDEHPEVQPTLNMTAAELAALQRASQQGGQDLAEALAAVGKTCWDCIDGVEGPPGGYWGMNQRRPPGPNEAGACAAEMRRLCAAEMQGRGMFMNWNTGWNQTNATLYHNQTIAAFLVTRPPFAFIGASYSLKDWAPLFGLDVGEPLGLCAESPAGLFSRKWSKGSASLDCTSYTAALDFKSLPPPAASSM